MGRTACTEPQCLYKGALYLTVELYLYSPYGPYSLYRASVPVQGCNLIFFLNINIEFRWKVLPDMTNAKRLIKSVASFVCQWTCANWDGIFFKILIHVLTFCQAILLCRWATNIQHFMQISFPETGTLIHSANLKRWFSMNKADILPKSALFIENTFLILTVSSCHLVS
jgi:hypothetical protein